VGVQKNDPIVPMAAATRAAPDLRFEKIPSLRPEDLRSADDATLAHALIGGHPAAPNAVWNRFVPVVRRIVRRSLPREYDVEDTVQDVFACLFAKAPSVRDPAALRAFIVSIALRSVRYELRRRRVRRQVALGVTSDIADLRCVEANPESREALLRFCRILKRINQRDRSAFVLRYVEKQEVSDIAAALDTSVPTARRCFTRAWRRVTFFASRDPFLSEYLSGLQGGAAPMYPDSAAA
jgi:RNA polymerase sigma-70 factor (ECF subfamily)